MATTNDELKPTKEQIDARVRQAVAEINQGQDQLAEGILQNDWQVDPEQAAILTEQGRLTPLPPAARQSLEKVLPVVPENFYGPAEVLDLIDQCEEVRDCTNQAIDYWQGMILSQAKAQLNHGDWLPLLEQLPIETRHAQRLMAWYKCAKLGVFEPAAAERKMSLGARTAYLKATPQAQEIIQKLVADPGTKKITAREIKQLDGDTPQQRQAEQTVSMEVVEELDQRHTNCLNVSLEAIELALDHQDVGNFDIEQLAWKLRQLASKASLLANGTHVVTVEATATQQPLELANG